MADLSRKVIRIRDHLAAQGATWRPAKAGWRVYPANGSRPIELHTSPRNPTQAIRLIGAAVRAAGHTMPPNL